MNIIQDIAWILLHNLNTQSKHVLYSIFLATFIVLHDYPLNSNEEHESLYHMNSQS